MKNEVTPYDGSKSIIHHVASVPLRPVHMCPSELKPTASNTHPVPHILAMHSIYTNALSVLTHAVVQPSPALVLSPCPHDALSSSSHLISFPLFHLVSSSPLSCLFDSSISPPSQSPSHSHLIPSALSSHTMHGQFTPSLLLLPSIISHLLMHACKQVHTSLYASITYACNTQDGCTPTHALPTVCTHLRTRAPARTYPSCMNTHACPSTNTPIMHEHAHQHAHA